MTADIFDRATEREEYDRAVALESQRLKMTSGKSSSHCHECGEEIPEARRIAVPGVNLCIDCQTEKEKRRR